MIVMIHPVYAQICTDCHDTIDKERFATSIHSRNSIGCTDCHGSVDVKNDAHDKPAPVTCETCHSESMETLQNSVHVADRDNTALTCRDCHGDHYILSGIDKMDREYRITMNEICGGCHVYTEKYTLANDQRQFVKSYFTSVHSTTIQQSGLIFGATCVDCHGAHAIPQSTHPDAMTARNRIPQTCGVCHRGALEEFSKSIHGEHVKKGNPDAPVCTDCHEKHNILSRYEKGAMIYPVNIPATCLKCHADKNMIEKYGFSTLKEENYGDSFHGAALRLGDTTVATCSSCHGKHNILPDTDPNSKVNRANLSTTCGECHRSENPVNIENLGKIHAMTAHEKHPISKIIEILYQFFIAATMGGFGFYIVIDLYRSSKTKTPLD